MRPSEEERDCDPAADGGLSRRRVLGVTGAIGSAAALAAVTGVRPAMAGTDATVAQQRAMILAVARAGAVFPLRLAAISRDLGSRHDPGLPADAEAAGLPLHEYQAPNMTRLLAAEKRFSTRQLRLARSGAGALVGTGLLGASQATLLEAIGRQAAQNATGLRATALQATALQPTAALAIATVFTVPSAEAESAAGQWLETLAIMYTSGTLSAALRQGGIR
jgi:hypothetical protein